jgi:succinate dehydrogenase/fumarate reductase flavoprotein subunit
MEHCQVDRVITTDVLIIGGGGGGIWAAIAASRAGLRSVVVSKGKVGNSGNTIMVGGSYSMDGESGVEYGYEGADASLTKEYLYDQIVKQSFYLAEQDLAEMFVYESPARVHETAQWCEQTNSGQVFMPPAMWLCSGHGLVRGMMHGLKAETGYSFVEDVMVVELLKKDQQVVGAIGVEIMTGKIIRFSAKAVILATGGYQPFTLKNGTSDLTGDGMAMAYRAGATLSDMEFQLFMPSATEPQINHGSLIIYLYQALTGVIPPATDKNGKRIEVPEEIARMAEGSELDKLVSTYYWAKVIAAGQAFPDTSIYLDFSEMTDNEIIRSFDKMIAGMKSLFREGYYHGESIREYRDYILKNRRVKVAPVSEYSMGGVVINTRTETGVPGLYAAGEVATGTFGACRVADAVVDIMNQGYKAGVCAAEYARNTELKDPEDQDVQHILAEMTAALGRQGAVNGEKLMRMIASAVDSGFGVYRTEERLAETQKELERLEREELPHVAVPCGSLRYNYDWICALQAKNLLTCTLAGVRAARARKESRGFHLRHDYPQVDNIHWAVHQDIRDDHGKMVFTTRAPKVTRLPIPQRVEKDIPEFMKNEALEFKNETTLRD